jgi:predicted metal-dependent hydrolase
MPFRFPDRIDPVIVKGYPEESFLYIGLSLLLPHLEPYLIRSMAAAKKHIQDPRLVLDLEAFIGQESQHYRQHAVFNKCLQLNCRKELTDLETALAKDYERFSRSRSLRFNLAYAEGFEALTAALTVFALNLKYIDKVEPEVRDLFRWHMVEELEHRTVAFDVYQNVCGSYGYRVLVSLFAQWHFLRFVFRVGGIMKRADSKAFAARYGGRWKAWLRVSPLIGRCLLHLLPKVFASYAPWYSPRKLVMPAMIQAACQEYTEQARSRLGRS